MSVHPPRETKTRRGADRRALGGRRASPCGGALVPLWGKSFPPWDFGVSAAAFAAAPRQHKPPSGETVERQDSDEAQTKGKTRMVKFITIRGTRALSATPYYIGIPQHERIMSRREAYALAAERTGYKATAIRRPLPHRFVQMADFACKKAQPSSPSRIRFCPMRFHCVINQEVSYLVFSV